VRKAEVDGNAAPLFFLQTIRIDAGEGADQRRLAVVDVSGGAYDERNGGDLLLRVYRPRMNADEREFTNKLFEDAVGASYEVANALGSGFLEKVYERALIRELVLRGHHVKAQASYSVRYKDTIVGQYFADLIVDGRLVVELKCADQLCKEHMAQCINYLKASGLQIALLVNFQRPKILWKRVVYNF
jgi:GxxExxY protein